MLSVEELQFLLYAAMKEKRNDNVRGLAGRAANEIRKELIKRGESTSYPEGYSEDGKPTGFKRPLPLTDKYLKEDLRTEPNIAFLPRGGKTEIAFVIEDMDSPGFNTPAMATRLYLSSAGLTLNAANNENFGFRLSIAERSISLEKYLSPNGVESESYKIPEEVIKYV